MFWFLMLLLYEIHTFLFWLFNNLIKFIKIGMEFNLKSVFRRWSFRSESDHLIFNMFQRELVWINLLFSLELYQLFFWLFKAVIRWRNIFYNFISKLYLEYECSEVILITSFWMFSLCLDESSVVWTDMGCSCLLIRSENLYAITAVIA